MTESPRIPLSVPSIGAREAELLVACITDGWVSSVGPLVTRFEEAFAASVGAGNAVACSSGTAAIHLALVSLGVEAGDEVWASDLTFIASVNPIVYCGARPVLIDSEAETWNLDPEIVLSEWRRRARIGANQPKALIAVSLLGHPADLAALRAEAEHFGVQIVEDAAEALGASWVEGPLAGLQAGTAGLLGCFSFNGNKVMTTGSGGMVVTDDGKLASMARHLSTQAKEPGADYRHDRVGFNYRLTNLAAAVGIAQLERLDSFLGAKRRIARAYDAAFGSLGLQLPPRAPWADPSYWLYSVLLPNLATRDRVLQHLLAHGVDARPIWLPIHEQAPFRNVQVLGGGEVASNLASRAISLPCSVDLTEPDQANVVALLTETLDGR